MAYKSVEEILDDLKAVLQENFEATLAAICSSKSASVTVPVPSEHGYFIANNIDTVPDLSLLPAVVLMGWNETIELAGEQLWDQWLFDIAVRVYASGREPETLSRSIYRYADAIVKMVRNNFSSLSDVLDVQDIRVDYSTVAPTEPLLQAVEITFKVRAVRDYS